MKNQTTMKTYYVLEDDYQTWPNDIQAESILAAEVEATRILAECHPTAYVDDWMPGETLPTVELKIGQWREMNDGENDAITLTAEIGSTKFG